MLPFNEIYQSGDQITILLKTHILTFLHKCYASIWIFKFLTKHSWSNKLRLLFIWAGTVPAKLLLQLKTALQKGGLCDRSGSFFYKDHLDKIDVPVLAIAGDQDLICPPEAVYGMNYFNISTYLHRSNLSIDFLLFLFCRGILWMEQKHWS